MSATRLPRRVLGVGLLGWSLAQAATAPAALLGMAPLLAARAAMGAGEAACLPSLQVIAATDVFGGVEGGLSVCRLRREIVRWKPQATPRRSSRKDVVRGKTHAPSH